MVANRRRRARFSSETSPVGVNLKRDGNAAGKFPDPGRVRPPRVGAVLREASAVAEAGRFALGAIERRRLRRHASYAGGVATRQPMPVILVPGFLAGDGTLAPMARVLREQGFRTYRSSIHVNAGCTLNAAAQLETRLESIALRRGTRVQIVGHSLGGMLARGLAVRRPDLVAGIVTLGSPMLAPGAHHASLTRSVEMLIRLSRAGWPGPDVGGLRRRRRAPGRASTRAGSRCRPTSASPRSTPSATASSTGAPASTRSPTRRGDRLPRRPRLRPARDQRGASGAQAIASPSSVARSRSRRTRGASRSGARP